MEIFVSDPFFTLDVEEDGRITWKSESAFKEELRDRGLTESQVSKVWRLYTDRSLILRYGIKGEVGMECVITRDVMSALAKELCIHGQRPGVTGAYLLQRLIVRADCFMTYWADYGDDDDEYADDADCEFLAFASPMHHKDALTNPEILANLCR